MPHLTQPLSTSHSGGSVGLLPRWIGQDQKVMFSKDGKHYKCYLDCIEDVGWHVSHRCRNGTERWGVDLPNLVETFQSFVDDGSLIPGWQRPSTWMLGKASHVSATQTN